MTAQPEQNGRGIYVDPTAPAPVARNMEPAGMIRPGSPPDDVELAAFDLILPHLNGRPRVDIAKGIVAALAADDLLRAPITDARLDAAFDRAVAKALAARRPRTWTDAQVEAAARVLYKLDVEADWRGAGVASRRWYTGAVRAVLAAAEEARDA